jgi:hypothetical protein
MLFYGRHLYWSFFFNEIAAKNGGGYKYLFDRCIFKCIHKKMFCGKRVFIPCFIGNPPIPYGSHVYSTIHTRPYPDPVWITCLWHHSQRVVSRSIKDRMFIAKFTSDNPPIHTGSYVYSTIHSEYSPAPEQIARL